MTTVDYPTAWPAPDPAHGDGSQYGDHGEHGQYATTTGRLLSRVHGRVRRRRRGITGDPIRSVATAMPSPSYSTRNGHPVRLIIFHTAEGALTTSSLGAFFAQPARQVSSHVGIDGAGVCRYVPEQYSAWAARSANPVGTQAELCGFTAWSEAQWRGHPDILEHAAQWAADESEYHGIPLIQLTPAQTVAGTGVCMHWDITRGWGDGTHVDCGTAFEDVILPQVVLPRARAILTARHTPPPPVVAPPAPAPAPAPAPPAPAAPPFPLPPNHYFGPAGGGPNSVSGYYSHGADLARWQAQMARRGWAITVDGRYGGLHDATPAGQTATVARQFEAQIGQAQDSLIGPIVWRAAWTAPVTP